MFDSVWTLALVPIGLGLFGFVEPCSIGSSVLFIQYVEGKPAATRIGQAILFTLTRALFIGMMGAMAALVGGAFVGFQRAGAVLLGALYVTLGLLYLTGMAGHIMRTVGPSLARVSDARRTAGLAILFGLNIPACATPLLIAVMGSAVVNGTAGAGRGFLMLMLFGLALSLPLVLALLWKPARRALDQLAGIARRMPIPIGIVLIVLGAWSIYFGLAISQP